MPFSFKLPSGRNINFADPIVRTFSRDEIETYEWVAKGFDFPVVEDREIVERRMRLNGCRSRSRVPGKADEACRASNGASEGFLTKEIYEGMGFGQPIHTIG